MSSPDVIEAIRLALAAPFERGEVKFKPQTVKGNRALAIAYVDARTVMDRLDDVFGVGGWQTSYRESKSGIICELRVRIGDEWVTHEDVGGESDQPDEGDQQKAAFSDSLKRAAVHLGIGRYLYRLKAQWLDYDTAKNRFVKEPTLPGQSDPQTPRPAPRTQAPAQPAAPAPAELPPLTPAQVVEVQAFKEFLDEKPDCEALNERIVADFAKDPIQVKKPKWARSLAYAGDNGMVFDRGVKRFVALEQETVKV